MKIVLTKICAAILTGVSLLTINPARASLISQMLDTSQAIVSITAENLSVFRSPGAAAAIDPASGNIIIAQKIATTSSIRSGAGVIVHPDGILVTNAHICDLADRISVTLHTGETFFAQPILIIHGMDVLFLKIAALRPLPFVRIADSNRVALGQEVLTIGHSAFLKGTITGGIVSGLGVNRTLKHSGHHRADLIQTTINLYQGDSGGPLFNRDGELIGLMTADERSADHSSFAIPSNIIQQHLLEYIHSKKNP